MPSGSPPRMIATISSPGRHTYSPIASPTAAHAGQPVRTIAAIHPGHGDEHWLAFGPRPLLISPLAFATFTSFATFAFKSEQPWGRSL